MQLLKWKKMGTNLNHEQTIMNNFLDSYARPANTVIDKNPYKIIMQ